MNDTPLHSALRETHQLARDPRSWAVLAIVSVLVGLIGPFGTFEMMGVVPRIGYWGTIVVTTAAVGTLCASTMERLLRPRLPVPLAAVIAGLVAGVPIALVVTGFNLALFGPAFGFSDVLTLVAYTAPIAAAVTLLHAVLERPVPQPETGTESPWPPPLLDRLPHDRRGTLLHLAVADHYVDVTTDRGTTLVLIRLADAIRETAPEPGLQVHRSHWVALGAVTRGFRQDGKPVLELSNGTIVPVSRTYLGAVKAAGLL
ncbi:LytTR family DNA-binding domain-containing protein [Devosia sp.]|uniref:LytTR family DNA-binding domain-containing protein n=1 Tax=Devosia sp. TaxID=1871048 RepID=UPI003A949548